MLEAVAADAAVREAPQLLPPAAALDGEEARPEAGGGRALQPPQPPLLAPSPQQQPPGSVTSQHGAPGGAPLLQLPEAGMAQLSEADSPVWAMLEGSRAAAAAGPEEDGAELWGSPGAMDWDPAADAGTPH